VEVTKKNEDLELDDIIIWNYCKICQKNVTPLYPLSESAYQYSFGKFLETTFYNHQLECRIGDCKHSVHRDHIRCFGYKNIVRDTFMLISLDCQI
jgi:1-phosphatidylinositol-3-phosphate 5-kinase